jgi:hypothetical protein
VLRTAVALVMIGITAAALLTVAGFWLAAAYLAMAAVLPHAIAALLTGAGLLVITAILIWIAVRLTR